MQTMQTTTNSSGGGIITKSIHVIVLENVLSKMTCIQCTGYLITVKDDEYDIFLQRMQEKYDLSMVDFEEETCSKCVESAFKCRHCNAIVCNDCMLDIGGSPLFTPIAIYNANARVPLKYYPVNSYVYCCQCCCDVSVHTEV